MLIKGSRSYFISYEKKKRLKYHSVPNKFYYLLYLIKGTYGQLVYKALNLQMKRWRELVIIVLATMQGCSYSKAKVPENYGQIHNYGKHPTLQNN